ncbi:hypothetical protein [Rhizobium sp. 21-4511-3d]
MPRGVVASTHHRTITDTIYQALYLGSDGFMIEPTINFVELSEIRALTERLFERLREVGLDRVPLDQGPFWTVFFDEAFGEVAPEPMLTDVGDCVADLRAEVSAEEMIGWHALHHLSELLSYLAKCDLDGNLSR